MSCFLDGKKEPSSKLLFFGKETILLACSRDGKDETSNKTRQSTNQTQKHTTIQERQASLWGMNKDKKSAENRVERGVDETTKTGDAQQSLLLRENT